MNNKQVKQGFTLIELLVVVLIIGILAAVALPQYQFAVDKSRLSPYLNKIKDVVNAGNLYFMANGSRTDNLDKFDIDLTKICPVRAGYNEMRCPNITLTILTGHIPPSVYLDMCFTTKCSFGRAADSDRIVRIRFDATTGELVSCDAYGTARGEKVCKWVSSTYS